MSNKPDWTTAPADAQFYGCRAFRKHDSGNEYRWKDGAWCKSQYDTIEHYEIHFDDFELRPESSEAAWNGQGLPPVGTVCEAQYKIGKEYEPEYGEILFMGSDIYVIKTDNGEKARFVDGARFYPIKSDRDKWIYVAREEFAEFSDTLIGKIYDALKSGKLPAP